MSSYSGFVAGRTDELVSTLEGFFSQVFARLSYKSSGIIFLLLIFFFFELIFPKTDFAFGNPIETFSLGSNSEPATQSVFSENMTLKTEVLKFKSKSVADPNILEGESRIVQAGVSGKKVIQTKTILHNGQKYLVENSVVSETKPIDEIIAVHPSVLEKMIQTPNGIFKYREKLNVWATSYDSTCLGCNSTTSIGLKAGFGVIAVDPKVIPLRSKVYIPGYGVAVAGDTGGSIKGNKIDLGFDNVKLGNWSARYTDIYILES